MKTYMNLTHQDLRSIAHDYSKMIKMCQRKLSTAGRISHYLKKNLPRNMQENSVSRGIALTKIRFTAKILKKQKRKKI